MSKHKEKQKLTGAWESFHAVIWMLGLAVIAWQGWWWPGILVLVAISALYETILKMIIPDAFITVTRDEKDGNSFDQPSPFSASQSVESSPSAAAPVHRADLLPTNCPRCGGPTRGHEIHWTGPQSADCPFCGTNLPMRSV
jgi:hypothetical protein